MATYDRQIQHLLRRAGFGATPAEVDYYAGMGFHRAIDELIEYHRVPDAVDGKIDTPGYVGVTTRGQFSPSTSDFRQGAPEII